MPPKHKGPTSPSKKATAKWNNQETEALISFLRGEADQIGGTSFKEASFTAAAGHISHLHSDGAIKMAAHCKTKWTSVSNNIGFFILLKFCFIQLKARFNTAERLATSSGAGASFNPRTGSSATTTSEQSVIDDFAASNSVFTTFFFFYYCI
jgi:hypothetical protein